MVPKQYAWLLKEPGPKMLVEALKHYGVKEIAGARNSPEIMAWADELGGNVRAVYQQDSTPWCGLFVAMLAHRAGKALPASPLWARAWATWGTKSPQPQLGDVLVFLRKGGGHVGLYVGENATHYFVLGGNQSDGVNIKTRRKSELLAARRLYSIAPPANVRRIVLTAAGEPSVKED